jgi:excisionase family DNA binding protein
MRDIDLDVLADKVAQRLRAQNDTRPYMSVKEAGVRLGLKERTVREMVADGRLKSVVVGTGARRIRPVDLDEYVEGLTSD